MREFSSHPSLSLQFFEHAVFSDPAPNVHAADSRYANGIGGAFAPPGYLFSQGRLKVTAPMRRLTHALPNGVLFPTDSAISDRRQMPCRGVRGATTVEANEREAILTATRQLLALLIRRNEIERADIASVIFTVTKDINAEFPALAARQLGWSGVPLLCGYEIDVPGSLPLCIRILVHWNTEKTAAQVHHVYARGAERLRPDLESPPEVDLAELEAWITQQMAGGA